VPILRRSSLFFAATFLSLLGCHAQVPAPVAGQPLPLPLARRVEVLLRQKAQLPPGSIINVSPATASDLPGFQNVSVTITNDGKTSKPISFLISTDGKTLAQFTKWDIPTDPRNMISDTGRPSRGGPEGAPVLIVGFDDLECPFCARIHATIFPALTQRYGDKVRIVYKDFPLDSIHPWAMRAAVDVNCLGAQSPTGYWSLVDYIHAHASEIGTGTTDDKDKEPTVARANAELDRLTREQATKSGADATQLDACLAKQDTAAIEVSKKLGTALTVDSTPVLFINGDKIDGALPAEFIFGIVDDALRAEGVTPPPPYVVPVPPVAPAAPTTAPKPTTPAAATAPPAK
jgi:protein-disulfide isomerase